MNKNIKKFLILMCICLILVLIYKIIQTYALFQSEIQGNVEFTNGTWKIKVNGTEISKGRDVKFAIDCITKTESEHIKPGKLAPGLSGSFEIEIDPTDTDVSIRYDIILNQENLINSNLKIKSIEEVEKGNKLIKTAENNYTGIISLEDINAKVKNRIKVEIEWCDNTGDDESDTKLASKMNSQLEIPVEVRVSQYLGSI